MTQKVAKKIYYMLKKKIVIDVRALEVDHNECKTKLSSVPVRFSNVSKPHAGSPEMDANFPRATSSKGSHNTQCFNVWGPHQVNWQ